MLNFKSFLGVIPRGGTTGEPQGALAAPSRNLEGVIPLNQLLYIFNHSPAPIRELLSTRRDKSGAATTWLIPLTPFAEGATLLFSHPHDRRLHRSQLRGLKNPYF